MLKGKEKEASKNLEDLAKLFEEFEEENSNKVRKMLIGVEKNNK